MRRMEKYSEAEYQQILERVWGKIMEKLDMDICQARIIQKINFELLKN
jgi:hypothetical protein